MFDINIEQKENETVIALNGEFDNIASAEAADILDHVAERPGGKIVVDCKNLEYISSSGLRFFMQLKKNCAHSGGEVVVKNLNEDVEDIFRLSGFHHIFTIL